jgi:beta-galactosidase
MFYFGVDYYPEHWPEERWPEDARLMAEAGFNLVRLAEFAWSRMEPQAGQYDFSWLDRAISILADQDIRIVLGTPTASPPPWLMAQHPEAFLVREDGRRKTFGNRREYCPNNPAYDSYSRRIVTQMAQHYAAHPSVIGWQIDNEFGDRCYCPVCAQAFRAWLCQRYGTLDELNERWGTIFWSHVYADWQQIPVPATTGESPNPGLALDYRRFMSGSYVAYQQSQIDILREQCPQHLITHNLMGFKYDLVDYFDLARSLDLVTWDNYQRTQWAMQAEVEPSGAALAADTMRGLKGKNFWVMEQQAGSGGWEVISVPPRPGELRLWSYQTIAHGADAVVYFRWRTARFGTEQYWHGLLDHDGYAGRRYEEIKRMGAELTRVGAQICGSTIKPAVAMLLSYDSRFAFQIQANNPQFSYAEHFRQIYDAFYVHNVAVDIVAPDADLSSYNLVVAPAFHVVSIAAAENLRRFVEAGGVLLLSPRSGVKDGANAIVNQRLPGLLAELCGVEVKEYDSLAPDMGNEIEFSLPELEDHSPASATIWCDVLQPKGAQVVATYTQQYYAGQPAITLNRLGQGKAVYVGTMGGTALYRALVCWLLELAGVKPILSLPEGVEVTERWQGDQRLLFVLNHTDQPHRLSLPELMTDLLAEQGTAGRITLAPKGVVILKGE